MSDHQHSGPIVVYDGQCGLCSHLVRFVLWADGDGRRHRFASSQSITGRACYAGLPDGLGPDETFLYVADGAVLTKSRAVLALAAGLGQPWRGLARVLGLVPGRLLDVWYDKVARHRYRIWGRHDHCPRPPRDRETRFLA
ncbi:thiol-disulfide oxidoreductase DCC family protein [Methylobacterium terrae]|nr:DCC1-like thiol-disulfide oxidoreductase family protein [Methylobacterium terrae]